MRYKTWIILLNILTLGNYNWIFNHPVTKMVKDVS